MSQEFTQANSQFVEDLEPDAVCILECTNNKLPNNRLVLKNYQFSWRFGRNDACDFKLGNHKRISNTHFIISRTEEAPDNFILKDSSTNGTYLNGKALPKGSSYLLAAGDHITVGVGVPEDEIRFVVMFPHNARSLPSEGVHADYSIGEVLGSGAFATVRRAVERSTGKMYAVKIIEKRKVSEPSVVQREIGILQQVDHEHIVGLHAFYEDKASYYLVMEYLNGGDLMDFVVQYGAIGEDAAREIVRQVLEGVKYVHGLGISHRDLKPDNILIANDSPVVVKVSDFGLAKIASKGSQLKTFCGTPSYLAPEVISSRTKHAPTTPFYSNLVDMWSIGCLAFVILTGYMPFDGETQEKLYDNVQNGRYNRYILDKMDVSEECFTFIDAMLEVDVNKRPSAEQALKMDWVQPAAEEPNEEQANGDVTTKMEEEETVTNKNASNGNGTSNKGPDSDSAHANAMQQLQINTSPPSSDDIANPPDLEKTPGERMESDEAISQEPEPEFSLRDLDYAERESSSGWLKLSTRPESIPAKDMRVEQDRVVIGRKGNVVNEFKLDIELKEARISKLHCIILRRQATDGNEVWLYDLSSNGCQVNGQKIGRGKKALLQDGDVLYLFVDNLKDRTFVMGYDVLIFDSKNKRRVGSPAPVEIDAEELAELKRSATTGDKDPNNDTAKRSERPRVLQYSQSSQQETIRPTKKPTLLH